ncbi:hypothetical protein ABZ543_17875 [Streptomyces roseifaciens]
MDIRGTAELIDDPDKELPRELSQKYRGEDPPAEPDDVVRLVVRVTPQKVTGFKGAQATEKATGWPRRCVRNSLRQTDDIH